MIGSAAEVEVQKKNTAAFISASPESLVLLRQEKISNGHGGFTLSEPVELEPQVFRMILQDRRLGDTQTGEGSAARPSYTLLGYFDADIQRGDYFFFGANRYDVDFVYEARDYQTKAEVMFRGQQS